MVGHIPEDLAMFKDAIMFLASIANIFIYCDIIIGCVVLWPYVREERAWREIVDTSLIFLVSLFYSVMNICYIVAGVRPGSGWVLALSYRVFGFTVGIVLSRKMTYRHGLYKRNWDYITRLRNLHRIRGHIH